MYLRLGDYGTRVREVQWRLLEYRYTLRVDSYFGPETENRVRAFQRNHGLVQDGIVGPKTWAALSREPLRKPLSQADIEQAAAYLGVSVPAIMAVNEVESRGLGFLENDGRPVILFERHIMYRQLASRALDPEKWSKNQPSVVNKTPGGYLGGVAEHNRLSRAMAIHAESAIESASWGIFQIMGFHWERLGFRGADHFRAAMYEGEANHLDAFVRFIKTAPELHRALIKRDWSEFARIYNGPNYYRTQYDSRMAAAYARHSASLAETA